MKYLQKFTYCLVIFTIIVHHTPILRAWFDVQTDYYYEGMAEELGLWD